MSTTPSDSSTRPLTRSTRDDSAYGGQKFDVEQAKSFDDVAPEMQLNRKGVGEYEADCEADQHFMRALHFLMVSMVHTCTKLLLQVRVTIAVLPMHSTAEACHLCWPVCLTSRHIS